MGTTYKPVYVVSDGSKVSSQWIELSNWSLAQITGGNSVTFTGEGTLTIKIHMYINGKEYVPSVTVNIKKKTVEPPPPSIKYGDVDLDGKVSAYDAALTLAEYAAGSAQKPSELKENQRLAADVDGDGKITAGDAGAILSFYTYLASGGKIQDIREWLG